MMPGRQCPNCGSMDTEKTLIIGDREEFCCFTCSHGWARQAVHLSSADPHVEWGATGDDNF